MQTCLTDHDVQWQNTIETYGVVPPTVVLGQSVNDNPESGYPVHVHIWSIGSNSDKCVICSCNELECEEVERSSYHRFHIKTSDVPNELIYKTVIKWNNMLDSQDEL